MNDELHAVADGHTDLEQVTSVVGTYKHGQAVQVEDTDGMAIGVEHLDVGDPMLACTRKNDRIHAIKIP